MHIFAEFGWVAFWGELLLSQGGEELICCVEGVIVWLAGGEGVSWGDWRSKTEDRIHDY